METVTENQLAQNIRQGIEELKSVCAGLDENLAGRAPAGRWSPKEILSHLLGPEGAGLLPTLRAFLDQDIPRLDIEPEQTYFSATRARLTFSQLLAAVELEYDRLAEFASDLSEDQLARKAHIPMLRDTPYGEYPSLAAWIGLLGGAEESHLRFHANHMREILQALGGKAAAPGAARQ